MKMLINMLIFYTCTVYSLYGLSLTEPHTHTHTHTLLLQSHNDIFTMPKSVSCWWQTRHISGMPTTMPICHYLITSWQWQAPGWSFVYCICDCCWWILVSKTFLWNQNPLSVFISIGGILYSFIIIHHNPPPTQKHSIRFIACGMHPWNDKLSI